MTDCDWVELDRNKKRRRPGSGSGHWVNVRKNCVHNDRFITFLSVIDVDLIGVWDGPWRDRIEHDVKCYPVYP